jgi:hypothetical protein
MREKPERLWMGPVVLDDFDDGWPGYEEPVFV